MKILRLSPYCEPEQISSSHLTKDMNEAFIDAGFTIENYVPVPSRGVSDEVREEYKKKTVEKQYGGKYVIRRFSLIKEGTNPVQRAVRYFRCSAKHKKYGKKAEDVDVIFAASTPPTQGLTCGKVKKKLTKKYGKKVPFVYSLQDVFPDSLLSTGKISKSSPIYKFGRKIEDKTYKNADKIVVISEDIKNNIINKGVPAEKITVIPNWIDTDAVKHVDRKDNKLFDELKLDKDGFYVVYAGNLGTVQGIDTLIDAAEKLKDASGISFLIFGAGSKKEEYTKRCEGLANVKIFPLQPQDRVPEVYSIADLALVACKKGAGAGAVPSKTFTIMASETPVLLSFDKDSELYRLIEDNDCGLCAASGDPEELAGMIKYGFENKNELKAKGANARRLAESRYSKKICAPMYAEVLKAAVKESK